MAKIEFNGENSKKRITVEDCKAGDIVLLNEKIYVVVTESGCCCYDSPAILLNLSTGEKKDFPYDTVCGRCQKTICFERSDFKEYID